MMLRTIPSILFLFLSLIGYSQTELLIDGLTGQQILNNANQVSDSLMITPEGDSLHLDRGGWLNFQENWCIKCSTEDSAYQSEGLYYSVMPIHKNCLEIDKNNQEYCTNREIMMHVMSSYKHPAVAAEYGIKGRVFVRFVIGADGSVGSVEVLKSAHKVLEAPSVTAVESLPDFVPGEHCGEGVPVYFTLPINIEYGKTKKKKEKKKRRRKN